MNIELLQRVKKAILDNPEHFSMDYWYQYIDENGHVTLENYTVGVAEGLTECGTKACIAGWAVFLGRDDSTGVYDIGLYAQNILDLTNDQARRLFHMDRWPKQFWLDDTETAAARIDHFIATGGRE
jgi:hypothetical protein